MQKLSSQDRSVLIRFASSLPSGSPQRKAILAGLRKVSSAYTRIPSGMDILKALGAPQTRNLLQQGRERGDLLIGKIPGLDLLTSESRDLLRASALAKAAGDFLGGSTWSKQSLKETPRGQMYSAIITLLSKISEVCWYVGKYHGEEAPTFFEPSVSSGGAFDFEGAARSVQILLADAEIKALRCIEAEASARTPQ